jgi:competence protein CoiA
MKFAVVEGKRREAQIGLSAECFYCGQAMIAKCGDYRVWHWAHRGTRTCDTWWEPETEWHRAWKSHFPEHWQERIHWSKDGEKHVADVKTESGMVIEFQHSNLRQEERESREIFYEKMVWVVDGLRRLRDRPRFFASLAKAPVIKAKPLTISLPSNDGALLREWAASRMAVFFDFGENTEPRDALRFDMPVLWHLNPGSPEGKAHLSPVMKTSFRNAYLKGLPLDGIDYSVEVKHALRVRAALSVRQQAYRSSGTRGFFQYMARRQRARSRVRF